MTTTGGDRAIVLLVELFVHPGREAEFRRFETEAARIMRRHGGRIDRVIQPTGPAHGAVLPHEIHLVSFASAAAFEAYRADPELRGAGPAPRIGHRPDGGHDGNRRPSRTERLAMSGRLSGKVAIVTGGASGIGRATCRLFGREGAAVLVADIDEPGGRAVAEEIARAGGRATFLRLDVTREADWTAAIDARPPRVRAPRRARQQRRARRPPRPRRPPSTSPSTTGTSSWPRTRRASMLGTKHAIPAMRRTGGGAIVNVVSIYAMVGSRSGTSYHASKGAARALTRATAIQYAPEGIRINAVFPGFVETGMTAELHARPGVREERVALTPLGRVAEPEDIAPGILYLASDDARFVTGTELVIDGGMTAR